MQMNIKEAVNDHLMQLLKTKRARAVVTYNGLADALGLPRVNEGWRGHPFCKVFEELDDEDAKAGRPFRTALVINDTYNMPGEGFFHTLQQMKKLKVPRDENKRLRIYMKELGDTQGFYTKYPVEY